MKYDPGIRNPKPLCRLWGLLLIMLWLSLVNGMTAMGEGTAALQTPPVYANTAPAATQTADAQATGASAALTATVTDVRYAVDFTYLQTVTPKSIAWLYQPNSTINQPVMFSEDAEYYLRRTFNDRISPNGAIFMTGTEKPDFSAHITTLYGRNCMDFTMFGSLSNYQENEYYRQNPTLYLLTPEGDYRLDIFAGIRTKLTDVESWTVAPDASAEDLQARLPEILQSSFIMPLTASLPTLGDSWAMLVTESLEKQGNRYVIYARKRPIQYATDQVAYVNKIEMDSRATQNGYATVENVGTWMLYAQNDPLWENLNFETESSSRKRKFGDGGCGPTAVAMAIANIVDKTELTKISAYASAPLGYRFCSCSVNDYWCSGKHLPYELRTPDEYLRYFPLVVANFATGNNIWDVRGRTVRYGTNMNYLAKLCEIYSLSITQTYQISEAVTALEREDTIAVACTGGYGSPFTNTSHFLVLARVKDGYLYALDPLRRSNYKSFDRKGYLEVIVPGLVRIKLENVLACNIRPIYLLQRSDTAQEGAQAETAVPQPTAQP